MSAQDHEAISTTIFDYAWAIDHKQWNVLKQCFIADCHASYGHTGTSVPSPHAGVGTAEFTGRDEIVEYIARTHASLVTFHLVGPTAISLGSSGTASTRTYATIRLAPGDGSGQRFESAGWYEDTLRRGPDRWQFVTRRYTRVWAEGNTSILGA